MKMPRLGNAILIFSLVCVAVTSGYVLWMGDRLIDVLAGPAWCKTALGAEQAASTEGTVKGLDACVGLLTIQLKSLATNSYILHGVVALCLLVLMVIVVAGGRLDFSASKSGVSAKIGKQVEEAAEEVAGAAVQKAEEIKAETPPEYDGPAMPEPKK